MGRGDYGSRKVFLDHKPLPSIPSRREGKFFNITSIEVACEYTPCGATILKLFLLLHRDEEHAEGANHQKNSHGRPSYDSRGGFFKANSQTALALSLKHEQIMFTHNKQAAGIWQGLLDGIRAFLIFFSSLQMIRSADLLFGQRHFSKAFR